MNINKLFFIPGIIFLLILFSCASSDTKAAVGDTVNPDGRDEVKTDIIDTADDSVTLRPEADAVGKTGSDEPGSALVPMLKSEEAESGFVPATAESRKMFEKGGSVLSGPPRSGLKAGYSDDNRQYGYFLNFLNDFKKDVIPLELDVSERIILNVRDASGRSVHGAGITISAGSVRLKGLTLADGSYQINPAELFHGGGSIQDTLKVQISGGAAAPEFYRELMIPRNGLRSVDISAETGRVPSEPVPLDIVFVMDTTGSMGEEISRLKDTIRIIHMNLTAMKAAVEIRFGMVLYKDTGDEYRTKIIPLTADLDLFQNSLDQVEASGGGDTPEDLEAALGELVNSVEWNPEGIKLAYIITDAAPHLDYGTDYSCADAVRDARARGIKIFGIGTGGLDLQGEYNLRQIAQYTSARYIFLIYGDEPDEAEGSAPGSVSHHTGSNWSADKLETIIIRFTREELAWLSDSPLPAEDSWFEADKTETETAEETLSSLFEQALNQLVDYSSVPVTDKTPVAVLPFRSEGDTAAASEYFHEHLILAAGRNERIKLADRKDIAQLLSEIEFQNLGVTDEGTVSLIGEFMNAEILISGNLFFRDGNYELFLKMLRVETAEVLSVTRAVIDANLGL